MSIFLDLIVIALVVLGIILGIKRGFVRTAIEGAGLVLILVVAMSFAQPVSEAVYEGSVRPAIENAVISGVGDDDTDDADNTVDKTFKALPGVATNLLGTFGITAETVKKDLSDSAKQTVESIAKKVGDLAAPPLTGLIRVLFVVLLFVVGMILVRLLAGTANKIADHIPVVGTLNKWLGGVTGVLKGLAIAFVAANLLYLLLSLTSDGIFGVTAKDAEQTFLFSRLCWILKS
ncbi:MAG: CvpA family protein [Clostridia bacterium]|nr:CvpA family protein [Clostridia bacterium]